MVNNICLLSGEALCAAFFQLAAEVGDDAAADRGDLGDEGDPDTFGDVEDPDEAPPTLSDDGRVERFGDPFGVGKIFDFESGCCSLLPD